MTTIYSTILEQTKAAMKAREKSRLEALRLISNEIKMHAINNKLDLPVNDQISISIMTKMIKQRNDSISQFKSAGRDELATKEIDQCNIIKEFMPEILSEDKTKELVITKIQELNVTSMAELGKLMQYMKKQPTGTIDLSLVSKLAKEILA